MTPFLLLAIGLLLIFLEFFLPGAIMGVAGGVILLTSIIFFAYQFSFGWTLLYTAVMIAILLLLVRFTLSRLRQGKAKGIFLSSVQEGFVASFFAKELIGKQGEALCDLKPAGHIRVEGKRYQAVAKAGYIVKGSPIEVIGGEGAHLVVKMIKESP